MPQKTILVIDDEHAVREMIKSVLEMEGYKVLAARSGKEALDLVKNPNRPCLILLDMVMPELNGPECLTLLKENPTTAEIPVVMISASDFEMIPITLANHIKKPFDLKTLLHVVSRYCA
jgi:CheY-like chemotaxis protein